MEKVGKSLTTAITLPILAVGAASLKMAMDFEKSMVKANTIANLSAEKLSDLSKETIKLSNTTGVAAKDLGEMEYNALSASVAMGDLTEVVKTAAELSKGGFADANDSLKLLTATYNTYKEKFEKTGTSEADAVKQIADKMIVIQNLGVTTVGQLSTVLGDVTPMANAAGISLDEMAGSLIVLTKGGISTGQAVTGLRDILGEVVKPSEMARKAASALGLDFSIASIRNKGFGGFLADVRDKVKETAPALAELSDKVNDYQFMIDHATKEQKANKVQMRDWTANLTMAKKELKAMAKSGGESTGALSQLFGSVEALSAVLTLTTDSGMKDFQDGMKASAESTGAAQKAADMMAETSSEKFQKAMNRMKNAGVEIGSTLLPIVAQISERIQGITESFASLDPETKNAIVKFALIAAAVGPVVLIVGKLATGIGKTITEISKLSRNISQAGGIMSFMATPGAIVVAVLAALVIAAILVVTHWDAIKKSFNDFRQTLKDNEEAIKNTAKVLGVVFGPALIKMGAQAVLTGTKLALSFTSAIIEAGFQAVITGAKITVSFIGSLIATSAQIIATALALTGKLVVALANFVIQALVTTGIIDAQTGAWLFNKVQIIANGVALAAHKIAMIASGAATTIVTGATWLFNAALLANPIVAVIASLVLLGIGIYEVVKHWKDICTWVEKAWNWLTKWNGTEVADKHLDVSMNTTSDGMQAGRNALGTSYWGGGETWVGEHGPEKVTLPKGSKVNDHQSSLKSGGHSFNIAKLADTIVVREESDIDKIADALVLKLNSTARNMA